MPDQTRNKPKKSYTLKPLNIDRLHELASRRDLSDSRMLDEIIEKYWESRGFGRHVTAPNRYGAAN